MLPSTKVSFDDDMMMMILLKPFLDANIPLKLLVSHKLVKLQITHGSKEDNSNGLERIFGGGG